jgi:hypothetical protein
VVAAALAVTNRMEDSVKLTDTQLVLLSAASQRDDRAVERPSNLTGAAADKVVAKLLTEGLIEEIQSRGSLPIWRRDEDGSRSLRISKKGLQAIGIEDKASGSAEPAKKPPAPSADRRKPAKAPATGRKSGKTEPPEIGLSAAGLPAIEEFVGLAMRFPAVSGRTPGFPRHSRGSNRHFRSLLPVTADRRGRNAARSLARANRFPSDLIPTDRDAFARRLRPILGCAHGVLPASVATDTTRQEFRPETTRRLFSGARGRGRLPEAAETGR